MKTLEDDDTVSGWTFNAKVGDGKLEVIAFE